VAKIYKYTIWRGSSNRASVAHKSLRESAIALLEMILDSRKGATIQIVEAESDGTEVASATIKITSETLT
jgi:hypothetical protein